MKALYEGSSRRKATLIILDTEKIVKARMKERKVSRKGTPGIRWFLEDVPDNAQKFDKGKGGGPWTNYGSPERPLVRKSR